jgi:GntR family transcriptional regulator/MocR family aminotransferase
MDPSFAVDRHSEVPMFRQVYERTRVAIAEGRLAPGARLPSARSLAAQLGSSRGTVDAAYAMLAGEGWIVARGAAGTVVAPRLGWRSGAAARPVPAPRAAAAAAAGATPLPFRMGLPALDAFPRKLWARLVAREARAMPEAALGYPDPAGDPALRAAIVAYLAVSRGVACTSEQVFVTAGYQGALSLISRTAVVAGAPVWVEDPGYHMTARGLTAAGARLVPIAVDADGMQVETAVAAAPEAALAVVTPAHQSPLGVALSLPRRLALLAWAEARGALIVEDDYDGELHYAGRPLPALKSLDRGDVVLYVGSFSKVLFPGLRLGYLVVPAHLVDRFATAAALFNGGCGRLEQAVAARFMEEGHFARHLKRMRGLYAARRAALAAALREVFGERLRVELQAGGMHLLARPAAAIADTGLVALAERRGLAPGALSAHAVAGDCGPGLLLSFTNIPEAQAGAAAAALCAAIGGALAAKRGAERSGECTC